MCYLKNNINNIIFYYNRIHKITNKVSNDTYWHRDTMDLCYISNIVLCINFYMNFINFDKIFHYIIIQLHGTIPYIIYHD